ncbi:50S ribosomal protein L30 [termite gut metagenome]|uniref:50S ribosomal protein L30 n=1 Tax=termite gut metagenome TaxID=433724 RepID=A0A5J4S9H2_9ZZZZ
MQEWLPRIEGLVLKKYLEDKGYIMSTIKIKQVKSRIGAPANQRKILDALGLRKLNRVVEHEETPSIIGMVNKVKHLVIIVK